MSDGDVLSVCGVPIMNMHKNMYTSYILPFKANYVKSDHFQNKFIHQVHFLHVLNTFTVVEDSSPITQHGALDAITYLVS
jgi:hypothetical protein